MLVVEESNHPSVVVQEEREGREGDVAGGGRRMALVVVALVMEGLLFGMGRKRETSARATQTL